MKLTNTYNQLNQAQVVQETTQNLQQGAVKIPGIELN
jgi:hypothetical protein